MLRFFAVVFCSALLTGPGSAMAADESGPAPIAPAPSFRDCPPALGFYERALCVHTRIAAGAPCTGSVEERLACLDKKVAKQSREIVRLMHELDKLATPRVQPLDERRISRQQ